MAQPRLTLVLQDFEAAPTVAANLDSAFRAYASYVATLAFRVLGRQDEVEDVVHDVFVAAHGKLPDHPSEARAWLTVVTIRIARRRLRVRRLFRWIGLDDVPGCAEPISDASPHQHALLTALSRALDRLPVDERLAWSLRHLHHDSLDAVAVACGCSLATAKRRIASAQAKLQEVMGDE